MTKGFTFTTILLFICTLVLVHSPQQVQGGVGCFAACAVACCEAGVFAFANPLGIAVGVTGCSGVCMVACATAAFVPPACFHQNTTIRLFNSDLEVPISSIKENDLVFDGSLTPAKVTRNTLSTTSNSSALFDFRSITLSDKKRLTVTAEHGVIIMVSNVPTVVAASLVSVGDSMMASSSSSSSSLVHVVAVEKISSDRKYTLETRSGSISSSGVVTTTICSTEFDQHSKSSRLDKTIALWKSKHNF